jgi:multidrug efflux pump subunit AcrA (membrane-fusion protein)
MHQLGLALRFGLISFVIAGSVSGQEGTTAAALADKASPAATSADTGSVAATPRDATPGANSASTPKPATVPVESGPVQKSISVAGQFVAEDIRELRLELKATAALEVIEAVKHGKSVKTGDVLVQFDATALKEQIQQQESSLYQLKLAHEESLREAKFDEAREAIENKKAEIAKRIAEEDHQFYAESQYPFSQKEIEESFKSTQDYVDYAAEEVRQLEKMYKADDLTEESEEIVLRRAKDDLQRSKFSLEEAKLNYERMKKFTLSRAKEDEAFAHQLTMLSLEQAHLIRPVLKEKKKLQIALQAVELEKGSRKLEELKRDLEQTKIVAPIDGVVYLGRAIDGKWSNVREMGMKLVPHGTIMNHEVMLTMVSPGKLAARGTISESDLNFIAAGMKGTITPTAFPAQRSEVTLRSIDSIPGDDGTFAAIFDTVSEGKKTIVAGMTGNIRLVVYFQPKAILVPTKVIHKEELDEQVHFVFMRQADGSVSKRVVQVGLEQGEKSEILQGLTAGEEVLLEKPASK